MLFADESIEAGIARQIDALADAFEAEWRSGSEPDIRSYLTRIERPHRSRLLRELAGLDLAYRRIASGNSPEVKVDEAALDDYSQRFSSVADDTGRSSPDTSEVSTRGSTDLSVACPFCSERVTELPDDPSSGHVRCPACGSDFHIDGLTILTQEERAVTLGRFQLERLLGTGAFGAVYLAHDEQLGRDVAVKVPRSRSVPEHEDRERFLREARSAARLRHKNIVVVHEIAHDGDIPLIVTDFIDGETLSERVRRRALTPREAADVVGRLAEALHYAHEQGVIHRDIKPSNILMDHDDEPFLTDFGLARHETHDVVLTVTGQLLGTPAYMAPEQAEGDHESVDRRSDIYGLGVVLYELIAGERPFRGNMRMLLHQVLTADPRPPRSLNDQVPRDLETVCLKAMSKAPGQRYASAADFAADLRRYVENRPVQARPITRSERTLRWCRRNPAVASLIFAVGALLLLTSVGGLLGTVFLNNARSQTEVHLARSQAQRGVGMLTAGDWTGLLHLVESLETAQPYPEERESRRRILDGWLHSCRGKLIQMVGHDERIRDVSFSPNGRLLATASQDGSIRVWHIATGREVTPPLRHSGGFGWAHQAVFSPDGSLLVTLAAATVRLWDTTTWLPVGEPLPCSSGKDGAVFSPNGDGLAILHDGEIRIFSLPGLKLAKGPWPAPAMDQLAISPDGELLVAASARGSFQVFETATGMRVGEPVAESGAESLGAIRFSPNGLLLAAGRSGNKVAIRDVPALEIQATALDHDEHIKQIAFSPAGRLLASASIDGTVRVWDVHKSRPYSPPLKHAGPVWHVAFSPDGRFLASGGDGRVVRLWNTRSQRLDEIVLQHGSRIVSLEFSKDSQMLASAASDGSVRIWSVPTVDNAKTLQHEARVWDVALTSDSRRLGSVTERGLVRIWDNGVARVLSPTNDPESDRYELVTCDISPDDRTLAVGGSNQADLWDLSVDPPRIRARIKTDWIVRRLRFSPSGRYLCVGSDSGKCGYWDLQRSTPTAVTAELDSGVLDIATSHKHLVAGCGNNTAVVLSMPDLRDVTRLRHDASVEAVTLSADGQRLATCAGGTVRVWNTSDWTRIRFDPPTAVVLERLQFGPDGLTLAGASKSGLVYHWDLLTGLPCEQPKRHHFYATAVDFSADGQTMATGAFDHSARIHQIPAADNSTDPEHWRRLVHRVLGSRLNSYGAVEPISWREWQELKNVPNRY